MDAKEVSRGRLKLKDDRKLLSPPWLAEPLYQCATAVTVYGFVPHATLDVKRTGAAESSSTAVRRRARTSRSTDRSAYAPNAR